MEVKDQGRCEVQSDASRTKQMSTARCLAFELLLLLSACKLPVISVAIQGYLTRPFQIVGDFV
jgi:hypothetical protein